MSKQIIKIGTDNTAFLSVYNKGYKGKFFFYIGRPYVGYVGLFLNVLRYDITFLIHKWAKDYNENKNI